MAAGSMRSTAFGAVRPGDLDDRKGAGGAQRGEQADVFLGGNDDESGLAMTWRIPRGGAKDP